jgi:choline-sulfatase
MSASPSIRPAQGAPPDANDLPPALQSIPAPRISLLPARSLLPDLSRYSLLAPPMGARRGRGHALLALTVGALAAGVVDGALGAEDLSPGQCLAVVGHCAAVMGAAGFVLGAALEGLLAAAARVVPVVRVWRWLARGPRAWFAPDPGLTTRLTLGLLGVLLVLGAVFLVSGFAAAHLHARWLVAVLVTGACLAAMTAAPVALVLLTAPLRALFARGGRLGSPGALGLGLAALLALAARAARRAPGASDLFEVAPLRGLGLLAVLAAVALVAALALRRARPRGAPLGALAIAVPAGLLAAALAVSALTLGESRVVLRAAVARSALSGLCVHALRRATDRDGDGASALFGGGDCDDGDARVHPGARDLPDNGVDENCSGLDGRRVEPPGDGHLARDTGLAPGARPSFVLITVDTLRPDHMSAYGYRRPTTPNVDVFARGAARFERAYAAVPRTIRSLSSIWTGRYPSHITWGSDILNPALGADNATLAEALSAAGYATAAFVDSNCFALTEGFFQGFGAVRGGDRLKGDARRTARAAADWIAARGDAPFFAWIHLIEPHTPYRRHAAPQDFGDADVDRYDAEIAYADAALAPVLDAVARRERERPAQPLVTVLSADHGEGLHDHGHATHGIDLHEEAVHVPLLVRAPGVPAGPRGALVSLVDLHATVLNYAGLPPAGPVESRSLVDALRAPDAGGGARRAHLFTEVTPDGLYPYEQKSIIAPPGCSSGTCATSPGSSTTSRATRTSGATSSTGAPRSRPPCARTSSRGRATPGRATATPSSPPRGCRGPRRPPTASTCASATCSTCSASTSPRPRCPSGGRSA